MEPKFQSSFIPKGPVAPTLSISSTRSKGKGLTGFVATLVFSISILAAVGVFGYKIYLESNIGKMGRDLEVARASLASEPIDEFIRLNNRLIAAESLVGKHTVMSPLFDYLESSTVRTVRFSNFQYSMVGGRLEVSMKGEAIGFSAVALQADIFNKSEFFRNPNFSDLNLDDKGNVVFSFSTGINPALMLYERHLDVSEASGAFVAPLSADISDSEDAIQAESN